MNLYEIRLKVYLTKNISDRNALEEITGLIDSCLIKSEKYYKFHNENQFKLYTHNSFYPLEIDRIYKAGKIYTIVIRTIDKDLYDYLKLSIKDERTESIKALESIVNMIRDNHIEKLYSITPVIIKNDDGYWRNKLDLLEFENRIKINLVKKYNFIIREKMSEDFTFFNNIIFNNKIPIACDYKGIKILGDKLDLVIANNENAQKLAKVAIGAGLGEMNSRGYGFVNYRAL